MKNIIYTAAALLLTVMAAHGQRPVNGGVSIISSDARIDGSRVDVELSLGYEGVVLSPNEQLIVTPLIINGRDTLEMKPAVFTGRRRAAVESREQRLGNAEANVEPYNEVIITRNDSRRHMENMRRANRTVVSSEIIDYQASVPYESWMDGSSLKLRQELISCHDEQTYYARLNDLNKPVVPVAALIAFIVPEYETIKLRTQNMTANVKFEVDKSVIKRQFANNDYELDRIDDFTRKILRDKDLDVQQIRIIGYASPEAPFDYNMNLSQKRVDALKEELVSIYGIERERIVARGQSEDWDSLRSWIASSDIQFRSQLLDIIDNTPNPDARDPKIKALDGGRTYSWLLHNVYPQLRRVDYEIDYNVAPFTVERGRHIIFTDPRNMSLNEMYMTALSYPQGSAEYINCFEVMSKHYPEDPVACNNMAAIALTNGDHETARMYLERVKDDSRCRNNMGVLYLRSGDTERAADHFHQAALYGSEEAHFNLANLDALH